MARQLTVSSSVYLANDEVRSYQPTRSCAFTNFISQIICAIFSAISVVNVIVGG